MADSYVVSGATLKCPFGTMQPKLNVLPIRTVFMAGKPMANISDHVAMINIPSFGNCRTVSYPPTGSATAAAMGTLTPMPCVPGTTSPWKMGKTDVLVKGQPALLKSSFCQCQWGGVITLVNDGQLGEGCMDVMKQPKESRSPERFIRKDLPQMTDLYLISLCSKPVKKEELAEYSRKRGVSNNQLWGELKSLRKAKAKDFYLKAGFKEEDAFNHLRGIDFDKPVSIEEIPPPEEVYQYMVYAFNQKGGKEFIMGNYFTIDDDATPNDLGIYDKFIEGKSGKIVPRMKNKVKVTEPKILCLKSTAAPICDSFSVKGERHYTDGGANQIFIQKDKYKGQLCINNE